MASALTWFFWLLSENPQVTTIIREEINKNLPRTGYDQENLDKLVYLHATLYETMRLYPPAPFQRKTSIKPDMLPTIWGGRRMGVYSETGELRHEPSYKFFSFNAGPRTCLEINKNLPRTPCGQENLDKLVYLHAAFYEAMRLYPPAPFQRKTSIKPDVLPSGHKVDANSTVMIFLYAMGRIIIFS
uniref:Cytochrome P450 n=1 Tax=Brassica oleracea TaxID=3712 RepID=A0A3P6BLT4_BRAOL|nr:unnamed protein product [Brassica oleracea]